MIDKHLDDDLHEIEYEVRAMLQRRAGDVHTDRPAWQSLDGPQVGVAYSSPRRLRADQRVPVWVRPAAAAASVLVVVFVGVMAVDQMGGGSSGDDGGVASQGEDDSDVWPAQPSTTNPEIPAPGNAAFDPSLAPPVHPVTDEDDLADLSEAELSRLSDPVGVATAYLEDLQIEPGSGPVRDVEVAIASEEDGDPVDPADVDELIVAWSTWSDAAPAITTGHVYLRRGDEGVSDTTGSASDRDLWIVVGARTQGIDVAGVYRDEDTLTFGVSRQEDETGIEELRIEIDDNPLQRGLPEGDQDSFTVRAIDDEAVRIRLRHVESEPISVFEMAVPALADGYYELAEAADPPTE